MKMTLKQFNEYRMPEHYSKIPLGSELTITSVHMGDEDIYLDHVRVISGVGRPYIIPMSVLLNSTGFYHLCIVNGDHMELPETFTLEYTEEIPPPVSAQAEMFEHTHLLTIS